MGARCSQPILTPVEPRFSRRLMAVVTSERIWIEKRKGTKNEKANCSWDTGSGFVDLCFRGLRLLQALHWWQLESQNCNAVKRRSLDRSYEMMRKEGHVKKLIFAVLALAFLTVFSTEAFAYRYTRGHYRSNGTYVQTYRSSSPDGIRWNNWSSRGNVNPFTGRRGSRSWF